MMSVLVTGGAGYIGSHTTVELIQQGYRPIVVDDFSNSKASVLESIKKLTGHSVKLYKGNCADPNLMSEILQKEQVSGVIHFAASKAVGESVEKPLKYYENNVGATVNLLKAMDQCDVNNLVFSSSCTVYGQPDQLPVNEKTPVKTAESPYGKTKQICEDIISDFAKSKRTFKAVSLRYFNPIGAHPSALIGELPIGTPNNLVPFITQTAAGWREQLTVFGDDYDTPDGTCIRDYIHVVDLAKAHIKAMTYLEHLTGINYDVFNLGTGQGNSVMEVVNTFLEVGGGNLNYKIGPRRAGDVEKVYADVTKAYKKLGWKTELSLKDSIQDAWRWQKTLDHE